jgi:hypothetical protein
LIEQDSVHIGAPATNLSSDRLQMDVKFPERIPGTRKRLYPFTAIDHGTRVRILKECKPMDARLRFMARPPEGEKMAPLCREFGIREVDNDIWQVSFLEFDLGYFYKERDRVEPGPSPFMPDNVLTMGPEQGVNHVTG